MAAEESQQCCQRGNAERWSRCFDTLGRELVSVVFVFLVKFGVGEKSSSESMYSISEEGSGHSQLFKFVMAKLI